jgi:hypothetical protein
VQLHTLYPAISNYKCTKVPSVSYNNVGIENEESFIVFVTILRTCRDAGNEVGLPLSRSITHPLFYRRSEVQEDGWPGSWRILQTPEPAFLQSRAIIIMPNVKKKVSIYFCIGYLSIPLFLFNCHFNEGVILTVVNHTSQYTALTCLGHFIQISAVHGIITHNQCRHISWHHKWHI